MCGFDLLRADINVYVNYTQQTLSQSFSPARVIFIQTINRGKNKDNGRTRARGGGFERQGKIKQENEQEQGRNTFKTHKERGLRADPQR